MSVGNRGMNYGQGQYPESPMACGPDMGQRNSGSQVRKNKLGSQRAVSIVEKITGIEFIFNYCILR